jgi:hypothetical protein
VYAVNPEMKLREKAEAIKTFVGFDVTSIAEEMLAAWNCANIHAVGSTIPHTRVKSERFGRKR